MSATQDIATTNSGKGSRLADDELDFPINCDIKYGDHGDEAEE